MSAIPVPNEKAPSISKQDAEIQATANDDIDNEKGVYQDDSARFGVDAVYAAKSALVNDALRTIGMNRWQYEMFAVCGFAWIVDNIAGYSMSVTFSPVSNEFVITNVTLTSISYSLGAMLGAFFWGPMADVIGRYWAFNMTLFLAGIFIIAAGAAPNIYTYAGMFGVVGVASGGNVPVASTTFLEFVPNSGHYLLTILSAWWAAGSVLSALVAWAFVGNYSCDLTTSTVCLKADNMGWRYTLYTLGAVVIALASIRFFIFRLPESPYFLLSKGRDAEALEVVQHIAKKSRKECPITIEDFQEINARHGIESSSDAVAAPTFMESFVNQFRSLSLKPLKMLFGTSKLALQTSIIIWIWLAVGIAYPLYSTFLPLYLTARFKNISYDYSISATYKQYCYIAACTVPGPVLAGFAVDSKLGRRYSMAISTVLSGVFLYLSTLANNNAGVVGFNCTVTLVLNFFFAIQYAYTPESFPAPIRATANGLCAMLGYIGGMVAPAIANQSAININVPVYVSGALLLFTGCLMFALPYETATNVRL